MNWDELIDQQRQRLMKRAEQVRPNMTEEDLLQPMDYPELEGDPLFRYEEGVLEGILMARAFALRAAADASAPER
jgi:hypothetical protein